jgi:beta-phosphoglucomutase-like phosphatase (HAD superfamily)
LAALLDREGFELALARAGLPADESRRDALVGTRVEGYLAAVASVRPIDDAAIAFVKAASERVALAIVSGAYRLEIHYVLDAAGLTEHFPVVVSIDDVTNGRPEPEGFIRAIGELNEALRPVPPIEPLETVAIEDATGGASAARAARMRVAAARGLGYDPASGYADVIINRLDPPAPEAILEISRRTERT